MQIDGTVAIVTGAAAGIGAAVARALVAHGARVVVTDLAADRVSTVAAEINETAGGERAVAIAGDAGDPELIARTIETARGEFGPVDLYVANAGTTAGMGLDSDEIAGTQRSRSTPSPTSAPRARWSPDGSSGVTGTSCRRRPPRVFSPRSVRPRTR